MQALHVPGNSVRTHGQRRLKEQMLKKNEHHQIEITDLSSTGEGIGKIGDFVIFTEGTLPGDLWEIRIIKLKKTYGYGKAITLISPSPLRVEPSCSAFGKCGGCNLQNCSYQGQLYLKRKKVADALSRIGRIENITVEEPIGIPNLLHYRNKAQYPVGCKDGHVEIGFYARRSHRIIPIDHCMIHRPINEKILNVIKGFMEQNKIKPYDELSHTGLVRHILIREGFSTGEIMVCIVINGHTLPHADQLNTALQVVDGIVTVVINKNTKKTNAILGREVETISGSGYIIDMIGDLRFQISALSFYQVNPVQTKALYDTVLQFCSFDGSETVVDLYCGIGTITLYLARHVKKAIGIEAVTMAVEDARQNASLNHIQNVDFFAGQAEILMPTLYEEHNIKADVIVIDPPRKGCDKALLQTLIQMASAKIIYVSCDPGTLARDLRTLTDGGYQVERVQPVDMFGMSFHVECVVELRRNVTAEMGGIKHGVDET